MNDQTKKVSKNREKKEQIVAELSEKVAKAQALVFTNYQGMTHIQLEQLKKALKNTQAELVVAKNTLLKLALKTTDYRLQTTDVDGRPKTVDQLEGQTATLFAYGDTIAPLKELAKSIRLLKLPVIKFGLAKRDPASQDINSHNWQLLAEADVARLSTLPSREVLLAQLVGGLKSPLFGLHRALSWNLQKLVITLKAIETKRT